MSNATHSHMDVCDERAEPIMMKVISAQTGNNNNRNNLVHILSGSAAQHFSTPSWQTNNNN